MEAWASMRHRVGQKAILRIKNIHFTYGYRLDEHQRRERLVDEKTPDPLLTKCETRTSPNNTEVGSQSTFSWGCKVILDDANEYRKCYHRTTLLSTAG